jgi:hypothetical protein
MAKTRQNGQQRFSDRRIVAVFLSISSSHGVAPALLEPLAMVARDTSPARTGDDNDPADSIDKRLAR